MTPANDNARLYRVQRLDIDTGRMLPGPDLLIALPLGAILGPIRWPANLEPFPNDPREA